MNEHIREAADAPPAHPVYAVCPHCGGPLNTAGASELPNPFRLPRRRGKSQTDQHPVLRFLLGCALLWFLLPAIGLLVYGLLVLLGLFAGG